MIRRTDHGIPGRYQFALLSDDGAVLQVADDGVGPRTLSGNDRFFDSTKTPSLARPTYLGMLARGWKVVAAENYLFPAALGEVLVREATPARWGRRLAGEEMPESRIALLVPCALRVPAKLFY